MKNSKPYKKYKASGIEWIESIPEHWHGLDVRKAFNDNKVKNQGSLENNLLTLSYGQIKRKNIKTSFGLLPQSFENYQIVNEGYLVLRLLDLQNDKNSLRVGYVNERGIITSAYIGLNPKLELNTKYYYYLLHYLDLIKHFYNGGGGVRQSIGFTDLGREKLLLPEIEEQTSIANFLDYKTAKVDRFIRKKKQLIKLLNEKKAGIINQAVTKGLHANPKMKPSGIEWLGDIPEHWEVEGFNRNVYLKHGFQFREEHFSKEGIRVVKITQLSPDGKLRLEKASYVPQNYQESFSNIIIKDGDILMALTGGTIGKIIRADIKEEILLQNYRVGNFYPINDKLLHDFLYLQLKSEFIQAQMAFFVRETGQPNIGKGDFRKINMVVPPLSEQQNIVLYIETETTKLIKAISTIEKEITLVQEYKTALIAEAVTGKIDVRDYLIPVLDEVETYEDIEEELDIVMEDGEEIEME